MLGNNWLTFLCQSFVLAATVSAIGVRPAADMAAAVKKLGLRSAVQANEHSAVETGAPDSNTYGLDEDTYAWMRQGINALRKQAASKMKKQLTDEYLNSLPLTLGDIMLTPDQLHNALRRLGINVPQRQKRNTINFNNYPEYKWSFPIKYVIDPVLEAASEYVTLILDSLAEWERQTCVLFERHDVSENLTEQHLLFTNESYGCFAYVGRIPETELIVPQVVNLETPGCFGLWGVIIHEIGHALGLWHQQSRPDRDTYVKILYENIIPETIHNFDKETTDTASTYSVPYDYGSVMHYGPTDFATQDGLYTIEPIDVTQITAMGQASGLSFYDHMVINVAYCNAVCPTKLSCQNGGYTNPKNCQACRCPDGWGGTLCDQVHQGSTGCTPVSSVINVHSNVTNATQYLQSPNFINPDPQYPYNGPYAMGSSCSWILQVPTNCVINFWFEWVGMLYLSTGTCAHWVEVQYKTSHVTRGQRFCGYRSFEYTQQNPLTSDSNRVSVIFSAPIIETLQQLGGEYFQGFHMFYEQGVCSPVIGNNQAWKTQSSAVSVLLATVSIVYALVR